MLAPGKKSYDKPRSILKSRDITLLTKVCLGKAMVFPVVIYGCERKKAEHWRIDAFELWCWRRFLRVPWTARKSNQSFLKEINPEYSLKDWCWSSKTLATWWEELTHWQRLWCWERLRQEEKGTTEDEMAGWHHWLNRHEFEQTLGDSEGQGNLACCSPRVTKSWTWLRNWTIATCKGQTSDFGDK